MKKVLCGIPTLGNIRIELAQQLYQWKAQYGNFFDVYTSQIKPLYEARNDCVCAFLKSNASYLFFVDSDAIPPLNAIERLSRDFNKKIVSGLCSEIKMDSDGMLKKVPMALREVKEGYKVVNKALEGVIEVDAAGTICIMIHRSVFKKLDSPWFDSRAEDFYFCEKAKEAGFSIYVDCECYVTHYLEVGV